MNAAARGLGGLLGTLLGSAWAGANGVVHVPFSEEALQRGLNYVTNQPGQFGDGVLLVDLDQDGDPDVVATGHAGGMVGIFENNGSGHFMDRSSGSGIPMIFLATGVVAGDYDRDGDLDLYVSAGFDSENPKKPSAAPNYLLRNEGGWQFTDVTLSAGVEDDGPGFGSAWGDYDNDGWLDLYLSNRFFENRLFRNLGDGAFEDVAVALGVDRGNDPTYQSSFIDFDRDGDLDLYVANDKANCTLFQNHFFENEGGQFTDITEASGTEGCVWSMSIAIGDFDNNLYEDMYVTNLSPGNALLMNQGDGTFTNEQAQAGVGSYTTGWGAAFFDYDNDGYLDLYVCNELNFMHNRLYRHEGTWPCEDVSSALGLADGGISYVVAAGDVDLDGDQDLLVQKAFNNLFLYINNEGQNRRWVKFDVHGSGPDRFGIGTIVDVRVGTTWRTRQVLAGANYLNHNEILVHFGLNNASMLNQVAVRWLGGVTRTLGNVPTNATWSLYPPDKLGDGDLDGDRDAQDFSMFAACYEAAIDSGCEMMDFDGDWDVDTTDFEAFLGVLDGPPEDCNGNGVMDFEEILADPGLDGDSDGVLDDCFCAADIDLDGTVGAADLAQLLGAWGVSPGHPGDLNGDGEVNAADLAQLLGSWGSCG